MSKRKESGVTSIDIAISIVLITIFIALIGNLIVNINLNAKNTERKTIATSYAIQEIEKIKSQRYLEVYDDMGIFQKDVVDEYDILDSEGNFSGYHKKIFIEDYVLVSGDSAKKDNLVKKMSVEITYMLGNKMQNVSIFTYVAKE